MASVVVGRRGAALAALLLGVLGGAAVTAPHAGAAAGRCEPGTGVTVVVDYGALGRATQIGCDPSGGGQPASRVVPRAGFTLTYAAGQPFVCRIDGLPDASSESCQRTPPEDAYWGLFFNDGKGGGWTYSTRGVASLEVPAGGSIGWRWQDGGAQDKPGAAPNPEGRPQPQPKPSSSPKPQPEPTRVAPQPAQPTRAADPGPTSSTTRPGTPKPSDDARPRPTRSGKPEARRERDDERPTPTTSADPSESPSETTQALAPASGEPAADESGSDPVLTAVAALAVVCLGAAAGVIGWRRRRG